MPPRAKRPPGATALETQTEAGQTSTAAAAKQTGTTAKATAKRARSRREADTSGGGAADATATTATGAAPSISNLPTTATPTTTPTTTATVVASTALALSDDSSSLTDTPAFPVKRRKLRKGTFSCIECKRRKVRCQFGQQTIDEGGACLSCQKHGTPCIGQQFATPSPPPRHSPDPLEQSQYNNVGKRIAEVEALVGQLVRQRVAKGFPTSRSMLGPYHNTGAGVDDDDDDTADAFDREIESILQQDAHCFSHWVHDRFMSSATPRFRRSPSPTMVLARRRWNNVAEVDDQDADDDAYRHRASMGMSPSMQLRFQIKQLEKELIANRLLFPAKPAVNTGPLEHQSLNKQLQSLLPTIDNAMRIMNRGALFTLRRYRAFLEPDVYKQKASPFQKRDSGHPVLLARELIQLAVCLQMMHKDSNLADFGLPGVSPWETADRYFEVASNLVTSQDIMVASQEGLESLLLQAFFKVNKGDIRGAWMTLRRALSIAQLIGLPPATWSNLPMSLHFVWTRLIFSERFISLMLGLPSSVVEDRYRLSLSPHSTSAVDWTDKLVDLSQDLERLHAVIIPRIAARNDRLNQFARSPQYFSDRHQLALHDDYRDTRDIDYAFQQAAQALPTKWWAIPDLSSEKMQWAEQIEEAARLMAQAKHYYFLVLLHLPYLTDRRQGFLPGKPPPPMDPDIASQFLFNSEKSSSSSSSNTTEETDKVNFCEFGAPTEHEPKPTPLTEDIVFAFGINTTVAQRVTAEKAAETANRTASLPYRQPSPSPSPPSNSSSTLAATPPPLSGLLLETSAITTPALPGPLDTTFSRLGALAAAREVLSRFMVFRHCLTVISRCHAFDFEAFVASCAILLTHIDAHARGRDNVIHYQRASDLNMVDKAVKLMEELAILTKEPPNKARAVILQRLLAVESDAAAGGTYEIWTEEGTVGKGDGWVTNNFTSQIQTLSVPFYGTIHIKRLSPAVASGPQNGQDLARATWCNK
ncbi:hypothetical protein SCUCBS95973_004808 [Sporothrix curviconia]|uniref:Zn(2)-C6 fungal-type domain-containing protein n=1 Tax=Sporothrix curviconia TaxID=1260050 RepID=A0ABP0BRX0_9PEZI